MNHKTGWIALALGLSAGSAALAQSSPYYIGATQTLGRTSNVFNVPDDQPAQSDRFSTTALTVGIDQPFGRQRFFADALARHTSYSDADSLNSNGYDVRVGLDWATIERLSGSFIYSGTQNLARLNPGNAPLPATRNLERTNSFDARAQLGGQGRMALEGGLGHRRVDYTAVEFESREYEQNSASLGLSYRPGGALTLSTGFSGQNTKYPRFLQPLPGEFEADRATRRDIYVGARWEASGASTVDARLSHARVEYDRATSNDFSGPTGMVRWSWRPTAKLQFATTAMRETGQEAGFLPSAPVAAAPTGSEAPAPAPGTPAASPSGPAAGSSGLTATTASDFSRVTNSLDVRAIYDLTSKVRMDAGVNYARRTLADGAVTGSDRSTGLTLGAVWTPTRVLGFGCSAAREARRSSTTLSSDYHANTFSCFGRVLLR